MSKKGLSSKGTNKSKLNISLGDLVQMGIDDAMRPERMDAFSTADMIVDGLIFATADIMKERELAVKVTPFAVIHTRKTMERLFDVKFFCYDKRKDACHEEEDTEPPMVDQDATVWDISNNLEDVVARRTFQTNLMNTKLTNSFKKGISGLF